LLWEEVVEAVITAKKFYPGNKEGRKVIHINQVRAVVNEERDTIITVFNPKHRK
jgi:hypothetical protein